MRFPIVYFPGWSNATLSADCKFLLRGIVHAICLRTVINGPGCGHEPVLDPIWTRFSGLRWNVSSHNVHCLALSLDEILAGMVHPRDIKFSGT